MNSRTIRAEASAWLSKLHGPERSVRLEADFQAWLAAKPEHARAFEQVTDVWETLGRVEPASASRFANPRPIAAQRPRRALRFAWAYVLVGLAVIGFWQLQGPTYRTDIGEQLTINLEDGSRLSLNSGSRVEVDFARHTRTVRLLRGEAFFEVAHDKSRPFTVIAGERAITAVGTAFVVRHDEDEVSVTLVEGRVVVTPREGAAVPSDPKAPVAPVAVPLVAGERLLVHADQSVQKDTPRVEATAAWRRGQIDLDHILLKDVVKDLNRYDRTRLVIDSERIGELPVSGIYRIGRNEDFARAVALAYQLNVSKQEGQIHLSER